MFVLNIVTKVLSSMGRAFGLVTEPSSRQKKELGKLGSEFEKKLSLFDPTLPFEHARAIPSLWYLDEGIYNAECQAIFGRNWIAIGRKDEAPTPKSYFQLEVAKEPIVVLRGEDDTLRAFSNVCRHRATQLLTDPQGTLQGDCVECNYHGWRYDLKGHLCRAPELGQVKGFTREGHSLVPFDTASWGPLVFVRMQQGKDDFLTTLLPLVERTKDRNLSSLKWGGRKEYEVACNWKVYVDNFLDGGYHVPTIHPALAKALNYKEYRTEVFDRCSLQHSPVQSAGDEAVDVRQGSDAMYWWVFPNLMVNIYKDVMDTNIVIPLGPNKCKVIFDFYFSSEWDKSSIDKYIESSHQVQLEDMGVCKRVQRGLNSQFYNSGPYAKREIGEHHFHKLLAQQLKEFNHQQPKAKS